MNQSRSYGQKSGLICALLLSACVSQPPAPGINLLSEAQWLHHDVVGAPFTHRFFVENLSPQVTSLHIYVGGDGRAFLNKTTVAKDPTPTVDLALKLALADPMPSGFLSRPCYYGGASLAPCAPHVWTMDRYAPLVIDSMVAALRQISTQFPQAELTLIGYSGGGVIALLAARKVDRVTRVVTVAAPLDTLAWTSAHGYTPLTAGSNPADVAEWPKTLKQIHLSGAKDINVTPLVLESFLERASKDSPNVRSVIYPGFSHNCCWVAEWPALLMEIGVN